MIKAAVGTHSELLAAASPCRQTSCESTKPVACPQSSGQVLTREAGQEMCTCPQDAVGTVGPTKLSHFLASWWWEGAAASELCPEPSLSKHLHGRGMRREADSCWLGWVQFTPVQSVRGGRCNEKPLPGHGAALTAAPAKGAQTHGCQWGANAASHPHVPGSAVSKSRANFCTPERLGSFLAAEVP